MNIKYIPEKRGNIYHAVMDLEGRKKGTGVSFYSSSNRKFVEEFCLENSSYEEEQNVQIDN